MATVSLWLSSLYAKGSGLRIGDEIVMFFVPGAWLVSAFELVIRSLIRDVVSCKDIGTCRNTGLDAQSGSPLSFLLHQAKTVPAEEQQQTYHMPRESKNVHVSHNHYGGGGCLKHFGGHPQNARWHLAFKTDRKWYPPKTKRKYARTRLPTTPKEILFRAFAGEVLWQNSWRP